MGFVKQFEDDGFVYRLNVDPSPKNSSHLYTFSQAEGYYCRWSIVEKSHRAQTEIRVTDDQCEVIIYGNVDAAIQGAREFLSV